MIKAVLFDVGGTLVRPRPSVGDIYSRVAARHGVKLSPADLQDRFSRSWSKKKAEHRLIDKEWWRTVVSEIVGSQTFADFGGFFEDLYEEFRNPENWAVRDNAVATLTELKNHGLTLAIASNWDSRLPELLERLSLARFFAHQFISFAVGFVKPDRRFFETALAGLKRLPSEVLHVGDDPVDDIEGAQAVGIAACHWEELGARMKTLGIPA